MPFLKVNGAELHYEVYGSGSETIVFAHGLLWSGLMFHKQIDALKNRFRCVTFDFRGQGQSEVTKDGYDMDTLAEDAAALIERLELAPCHFAGLSMGGFIGMRLAIRRPQLLKSLTLMETSADAEPEENRRQYRVLNFIARWFGLGLVASRVMPIMFGGNFLTNPERKEERDEWRSRMAANHRVGISRAVGGVINRDAVFGQIDEIKIPTLIIVGDQDVATVPEKAERMHDRIEGSEMVVIPGAGHTASLEEPDAINAAMQDFLARQ